MKKQVCYNKKRILWQQ